jgi:hypothetical protein
MLIYDVQTQTEDCVQTVVFQVDTIWYRRWMFQGNMGYHIQGQSMHNEGSTELCTQFVRKMVTQLQKKGDRRQYLVLG